MLDYERRRKKGLAKARQAEIAKAWEPLRHIQAEEDASSRSRALTQASDTCCFYVSHQWGRAATRADVTDPPRPVYVPVAATPRHALM